MSNDEILLQLKRILSSSPITNSTVLSEFLSFVVTETLAGRGRELKEYTIGIQALHKEPDFNPQLDSIVRIHAGRLRRALKEYYYEEGKYDPVLIVVPKGSYMPIFTLQQGYPGSPEDESHTEIYLSSSTPYSDEGAEMNDPDIPIFPGGAIAKPTLAVLSFSYLANERFKIFAKGLSEYLRTELTHFEEITISSHYATSSSPLKYNELMEQGVVHEVDYILTGSVQGEEDPKRIFVQLIFTKSGKQIWANTFDRKSSGQSSWEFQDDVVTYILAAITGINGAIVNYERIAVQQQPPDTISTFPLTYWYYRYCNNFNLHNILKAKTFYEQIYQQNQNDPLVLAYLSELYSAEAYVTLQPYNGGLERATSLAQNALRLHPRSQQAHISLAITLLLTHRHKECIHTIEQGFSINTKSVDYKGAMGSLIIYAGEFEKGISIINEAIALNPYLPWWHSFGPCLYSYYKQRYADTIFLADTIEQNILTAKVIKVAAYAELEEHDQARSVLDSINASHPSFDVLNYDQVNFLFVANPLVGKIMKALEKAINKPSGQFVPTRH